MRALPTFDDRLLAAGTAPEPAQALSPPSEARTAAEILRELRAAYPDSPLAVRVRALAALQRR